jgi:hypothetical protein
MRFANYKSEIILIIAFVLIFVGPRLYFYGGLRLPQDEKIFLWRSDLDQNQRLYEFNIGSKEFKPLIQETQKLRYRPLLDLDDFVGLPEELDAEDVFSGSRAILHSKKFDQVIVRYTVYDRTAPPNDFGYPPPELVRQHFSCVLSTKKCTLSNIIETANNIAGSQQIYWSHWDSDRGLLIGYPFVNADGNPISIVNLLNNNLQVIKSESSDFVHDYLINPPDGYLSPSWTKLVVEDRDTERLLLYSTVDLSKPVAVYDIPDVVGADQSITIEKVVWNHAENKLALLTVQNATILDLETGEKTLVFKDKTRGENGSIWAYHVFSSNDRYLSFIDYTGQPSPGLNHYGVPSEFRIIGIDLENKNRVLTLFKGKDSKQLTLLPYYY